MKKLFILFGFCTFLLFSCEVSDNTITEKDTNVDLKKIENLKVMQKSQQKIAYRLLNNGEKLKLWNDRLSSLVSIRQIDDAQKNSIKSLQKILNIDFFSTNSNEAVTLNEDVKGWIIENESKFTRNDFVIYFTTLNEINMNHTSRNDLIISDVDPDEDDCECNELEDYCIGASFECNKTKCNDSYKGCGFLWNASCNGECEHKDS